MPSQQCTSVLVVFIAASVFTSIYAMDQADDTLLAQYRSFFEKLQRENRGPLPAAIESFLKRPPQTATAKPRRMNHPCRWKLCGAYSSYPVFVSSPNRRV